jgi:pimeloyl-ACP methyl ester carboxylesterase
VRVLERDRRVTAPRLPQGRPVDAWAEQVIAHLDEPAVVYANSLGCQTAVEVAVRRPELVLSLVLVGPTADPSAPGLLPQFARLARDCLHEPLGLNCIVASDYVRNGPLRTLRGARLMLAHAMAERLPLVAAPTVVVRGQHDAIVSQGWAERVARLVPDGRLEVIRGAAHCAHYTHPERVAASARPQR